MITLTLLVIIAIVAIAVALVIVILGAGGLLGIMIIFGDVILATLCIVGIVKLLTGKKRE